MRGLNKNPCRINKTPTFCGGFRVVIAPGFEPGTVCLEGIVAILV